MTRALRAGAFYFAIVFAAGFVLGTLRVLVLIPRWGEVAAVLAELPVMLAISWGVCRALVAHVRVAASVGARLLMGGVAFAMLITAEFGLGAFAFGRPFADQLAALQSTAGALGLAGQFVFALVPLAQLRRSGLR